MHRVCYLSSRYVDLPKLTNAYRPVGEVYIPSYAQVATPLLYTTIAFVVCATYDILYTNDFISSASLPTVSGATSNCGLYYGVQIGDNCNTIALNFSLTFDQLVGGSILPFPDT